MIQFNDLKADYQYHKRCIDDNIQKVLESGWHILGSQVENFEQHLASYSGTKYTVTVANGLDALEISLRALNIGTDDEVITSPISAFATTIAILNVGAIPVFVDIDSDTGLITPQNIKKAISKKTKAVLPVNLYGQMIDIQAISKICKKNKLYLIEDSAQAVGASINDIKTGQLSDAACLSFYPTKNLGAYGDGGAIITNDQQLYEKAKCLRHYGQDVTYHHIYLGKNSRLDEIQAAILDAKLIKLKNLINKRIKIAFKYQHKIHNPKIQPLSTTKGHTYHLFVIKSLNRKHLQKYLMANNIQSLIHYPIAQYDQPAIKKLKFINKCTPKVVARFCNQVLSIPIHPFLTTVEVDKIIKALNNY